MLPKQQSDIEMHLKEAIMKDKKLKHKQDRSDNAIEVIRKAEREKVISNTVFFINHSSL